MTTPCPAPTVSFCIAPSTSVSPMGDHDDMPPSVCPTANTSVRGDATRTKRVRPMAHPPGVRATSGTGWGSRQLRARTCAGNGRGSDSVSAARARRESGAAGSASIVRTDSVTRATPPRDTRDDGRESALGSTGVPPRPPRGRPPPTLPRPCRAHRTWPRRPPTRRMAARAPPHLTLVPGSAPIKVGTGNQVLLASPTELPLHHQKSARTLKPAGWTSSPNPTPGRSTSSNDFFAPPRSAVPHQGRTRNGTRHVSFLDHPRHHEARPFHHQKARARSFNGAGACWPRNGGTSTEAEADQEGFNGAGACWPRNGSAGYRAPWCATSFNGAGACWPRNVTGTDSPELDLSGLPWGRGLLAPE